MYIKFLFCLGTERYERHRDVVHEMHSSLVTYCLTLRSFWLWLIVIVPIICLSDVFLRKAMTAVALNPFPNVLLIFNICQCLLIIFLWYLLKLDYVTENGITFFCTALVLFNRVDPSILSTFSIWFRMKFSLDPFWTNRSTKSFECLSLSLKVE